jgi:hypothetical protein
MPVRGRERRAGIEANVRIAGDQRVVGKPLIFRRVGTINISGR